MTNSKRRKGTECMMCDRMSMSMCMRGMCRDMAVFRARLMPDFSELLRREERL